MNTINDGGPAFPTSRLNTAGEVVPDEEGMTLRDYFAAAALQGVMAGGSIRSGTTNAEIAAIAYRLADAMLKARDPK